MWVGFSYVFIAIVARYIRDREGKIVKHLPEFHSFLRPSAAVLRVEFVSSLSSSWTPPPGWDPLQARPPLRAGTPLHGLMMWWVQVVICHWGARPLPWVNVYLSEKGNGWKKKKSQRVKKIGFFSALRMNASFLCALFKHCLCEISLGFLCVLGPLSWVCCPEYFYFTKNLLISASKPTTYEAVGGQLMICQLAMIMEVVHPLLGFVKTSPFMPLLQVRQN